MKRVQRIALAGVLILIMRIVPVAAQQITIYNKSQSAGTDTGNSQVLSLDDALKMPQETMRTSTNWTNEELFRGVKMREMLKHFGLYGKTIHFICYDGYDYRIPMSDVVKYDLLLAYERNGKRMTIKTLGPFALIYPRSKYPKELGGQDVDAKFIWMIKNIYVE
ncbi:molybdopterin-dependent oxidoreductase [Paraburkholderia humisilvae]|uniref:Oxidoreductase molybdopterin-binding domain-containing protein n=1 Tax=Paraburkholderia humisilvae TaxID=627669 RepID=A0A6J5F0V3_9BURK|nr:molybdopterin-dependent oxidoreductase [Paraburkholderia humisilvae]CAB3772033.1 hypothetical protein LMG29542_06775 [Paraburkholderia humisilvae]